MYQDGKYLKNNPNWHLEDAPLKAGWIVRMLDKNGIVPVTLADIGCGAGEVLVRLSARWSSCQMTGFDISPDAARFWPERTAASRQYVQGDIMATDGAFGVVTCMDVIEHVEDYFAFLRSVAPKGEMFVFNIPLEINLNTVLRHLLVPNRRALGHIHHFTKETALATLDDTGYEVRDWFYAAGTVERPRNLRQHLAAWPRRLLGRLSMDWTQLLLGGYSLMVLAVPKR